jgi:predicted protein tyrosine phosphatase
MKKRAAVEAAGDGRVRPPSLRTQTTLAPWVSAVAACCDAWTTTSTLKLPAEIAPWLLLSDAVTAHDVETLTQRRVTHVLNMAGGDCDTSHAARKVGAAYKRINSEDSPSYPLLSRHWREAFAFIQNAREDETRDAVVLVHCVAGVNRSGLIAAAALMVNDGVDVVKAVERVKVARGTLLYNKGFQRQLVELAHEEGRLGPHPYAEEEDKAAPTGSTSLDSSASTSKPPSPRSSGSRYIVNEGAPPSPGSHCHEWLPEEDYDKATDRWTKRCKTCPCRIVYERQLDELPALV